MAAENDGSHATNPPSHRTPGSDDASSITMTRNDNGSNDGVDVEKHHQNDDDVPVGTADPAATTFDDPPRTPETRTSARGLTLYKTISRVPTRNIDRQLTLTKTISRHPVPVAAPQFSLGREIIFVALICMAQLLTQASLAQSIAPLHVIGRSLGTENPGELSWLPAGYSLTVGTFILPAGRWGDLYGHRNLFFLGWLWFGVWTLVAGFGVYTKHTVVFFAVCRGLQGIGPAILIPNGLAILGRTYPAGPRKNLVFSLFGATAPGGFWVGALMSGILAQCSWWPWAFWIEACVIAFCAACVYLVIPDMPVAGGKPELKELDICGTALGISGLILFNFAWNQGPTVGWPTVYVYVLLAVGVGLLAVFVWWELKVADHPLLYTPAFTKETSLVLTCIACGWASFGIWTYYFWQFLELLRHKTIILSAVYMFPLVILGVIAAIATAFLLGRIGPGYVMLLSMLAFCGGNILLATMPVHQTYWANAFVSTLVMPFGMDFSFPAGSIIISNFMPYELQGIAASILCVIQNYSISVGLGMAGTVERYTRRGDMLRGYRGAWYLSIGFTALGIISALLLVASWRATQKSKEKEGQKVTGEE